MSIVNTYPIFEADQVLTNNHLNGVVNYLDQQNRLTRNKLIGSGIVCGLDVHPDSTSIIISKGCALTTQGFLITLCESEYTHYIGYTPPPFPEDLLLIRQCGPIEGEISNYYKLLFAQEVFQLVKREDVFDFTGDEVPIPLEQAPPGFTEKYAVVLFVEPEQLDLKNCDTNDCNDKGSQMNFEVKALLVPKEVLERGRGGHGTTVLPQQLSLLPPLRRYNVPFRQLNTSAEVLNTFVSIVDVTTLKSISEALKQAATQYHFILKDESPAVFDTVLDHFTETKELIVTNQPVLIQYVYDYMDDIIRAFNEFVVTAHRVDSVCCLDEMLFPFHVMLGEADRDSSHGHRPYREYFIHSPLFDDRNHGLAEARSLFTRLRLLIAEFTVDNMLGFEKKDIRFTPSFNGAAVLSDRCIPYYYDVAGESQLLKFWNFNKTRVGKESMNLGYNASQYSQSFHVINPLLFDIEPYNFFRIEGHVGKHVTDALREIKLEQQQNNLPFEVVALSADYIGTLIRGEEPKCVIQDLESDYRVLIAEFVCRLHDGLCIASGTKYIQGANLGTIVNSLVDTFFLANTLSTRTAARTGTTTAATRTKAAKAAVTTAPSAAAVPELADEDKLVLHSMANIASATDHIFVSQLVNEFHLSKGYQKGTTLQRLCNPATGTVGHTYISNVRNNKGVFRNPVLVRGAVAISPFHFELYEFIDRVESAFAVLMSSELAELSIDQFKAAYKRLEAHVANLRRASAVIKDEVRLTFDSCIIERLEALKNEYLRRTAQYRLAKNFSYYFSKHGGVEHKAGVTKGGTFLIVYHEERRRQVFDIRSVLVNKEIGSILLKQFPALLEATDDKDELEAKTKELQLATQFRDPELFLRTNDVLRKYLDECKDIPDARKEALRAIINVPPVTATGFKLNDGVVIADFYIPYLCCSDCPPIAYILPPAPAGPSLSLDKNKFCGNDKGPYEIRVSPGGGTMTIDDKKLESEQGTFFLTPSAFKPGTHIISYTSGGSTSTLSFDIVAPPKVSFKAREPQDEERSDTPITITLNSNATAEAEYNFEFGDGGVLKTTEKSVTHTYSGQFDGDVKDVTIKVTVTDGPCTIKVEKTFKLFKFIIL